MSLMSWALSIALSKSLLCRQDCFTQSKAIFISFYFIFIHWLQVVATNWTGWRREHCPLYPRGLLCNQGTFTLRHAGVAVYNSAVLTAVWTVQRCRVGGMLGCGRGHCHLHNITSPWFWIIMKFITIKTAWQKIPNECTLLHWPSPTSYRRGSDDLPFPVTFKKRRKWREWNFPLEYWSSI